MFEDVDECIATLMKGEILSADTIRDICSRTKEVLAQESNVRHVAAPVTVVGDVHGQLYDLFEIFKIGGEPPYTNYLFLGDYVDRGRYNVETISLLVCLKLRYPERITLLRGNHESRAITQVYGFYKECLQKYSGEPTVWEYFVDLFDYFNLGAIIDNKIFCVHGGLSPSVHSVDQICILNRFVEPPGEGAFADLMWSDPSTRPGFNLSQRNAGYTFGEDVTERFLSFNGFDSILRAHQLCNEGYQVWFDGKLSTVWSAPNYCYRCGNVASILEIDENLNQHFNIFSASPDNDKHIPPENFGAPPEYFL